MMHLLSTLHCIQGNPIGRRSKWETEVGYLVDKIKSDPFVPREIRELAVDLLEGRLQVWREVHREVFEEYGEALASGSVEPADQLRCGGISNRVNRMLYDRGCGISQIQEEVHGLRAAIQRYFEAFDPR